MSGQLAELAHKKWFVPLLLSSIFLIALSALLGGTADAVQTAETEEERLASLCNAVEGVSEVRVMITYEAVEAASILGKSEERQRICGIAVVCRGGNDPSVQLALHRMLESLYALPSTRISVSGSG